MPTHRLTINVSDEVYLLLKKQCALFGEQMSTYIEMVLMNHLEKQVK